MKMALKNVVGRLKRTLLCCKKRQRKHSLDIGSPTDVRQLDITETMNLTEAHAKIIRENPSSTTHLLLSLSSHPPTNPNPFSSAAPSTTHLPASTSTSSTSTLSLSLPNAASSNLPPTLPTPPRQKHTSTSPPTPRVARMWDHARSGSPSASASVSASRSSSVRSRSPGEDGVVMLELDLEFCDKEDGGFEAQDVVGGMGMGTGVQKAVEAVGVVDSSDTGSERDGEGEGRGEEMVPLVRM